MVREEMVSKYREQTNVIWSNMDATGDYRTKWSKSEIERQMPYGTTYALSQLTCSLYLCAQPLSRVWLSASRLLCPCNFPAKNAGVGCHFLLQGVCLTQGSNFHLLHLLHWQADSLPLCHLGIPWYPWQVESKLWHTWTYHQTWDLPVNCPGVSGL